MTCPAPGAASPCTLFHYRAYDLELDLCQQEHGVWLDGGEEKRVLEIMRQRIKDLGRSASAEAQWAGMLQRLKSGNVRKGFRGLFRK